VVPEVHHAAGIALEHDDHSPSYLSGGYRHSQIKRFFVRSEIAFEFT
jgi:hypothetical protein